MARYLKSELEEAISAFSSLISKMRKSRTKAAKRHGPAHIDYPAH